MPFAIYNCSFIREYAFVVIFLIVSIFAVWMKDYKNKDYNSYNKVHFVLYTIISIICIIFSSVDSFKGLLLATLYVAMNFFLELDQPYEGSNYLEPVSISLFIISICNQSYVNMKYSMIFILMSIVFTILYYFSTGKRKDIYWFSTMISILLSIINNAVDKEAILSIIGFLPTIYLFYDINQRNESTEKLLYSFFMLILVLYNFFYIVNPLNLTIILSSILFIYILGTFILLTKTEGIKKNCYLAIVIPLFKMIAEITDDTSRTVLISILILYIDFLIVKFFAKNNDSKNVLGLIGIILAILIVLPIENYLVGIYIGLIGLITIMIGFSSSIYKSFFKAGVIITIINILYQLREVWEQIPFSFYLLIGGLGIIGFVTVKEMKNKK